MTLNMREKINVRVVGADSLSGEVEPPTGIRLRQLWVQVAELARTKESKGSYTMYQRLHSWTRRTHTHAILASIPIPRENIHDFFREVGQTIIVKGRQITQNEFRQRIVPRVRWVEGGDEGTETLCVFRPAVAGDEDGVIGSGCAVYTI